MGLGSSSRVARSSAWLCCAALWALIAPRRAHAEDEAQAAARAAYSAGVEAYARGDDEQARRHFSAAEASFPSPNIELMLGRTLLRLQHNVEAHRALTRAVENGGKTPKYASTATAARVELSTLEKSLAIVRLRCERTRGDETLRVNGELLEPGRWSEPLVFEPGTLHVEATRPGGPADTQQLELAAGSSVTLTLTIPELPRPVRIVPLQPSAAPSRPVAAPSHSALRGVGYALIGIGAAGIAAFGALGAVSHAQHTKLEAACPNADACDIKYRSYASRGQTYQTAANIALAAGAGVLVSGITLWIVSLPEERATVALTPTSLEVRGSF